MARVVRFHRHGGAEVLVLDEVEVPAPGAGEVRISVSALGLNRAEVLMREGAYIEAPKLPSGLGLEAAGVVDAVGDGVSAFAPGDAVSVIPPISMARYPTHGEVAILPQAHVVKHPAGLRWEATAALWMPYLTAYGALIDIARLKPGDFVAITAASSSVGLAAIQVARKVGATPIAITRTSAKREALSRLGATHVVGTDEGNVAAGLNAIAGPSGIRVVLDAVGGPLVTTLADAMSRDGILLEYGGLSPEPTPFPLFTALGKRLTMKGYLVHEVIENPTRLEGAKTFILDGLASGDFNPAIARTFPFEKIKDAYRYLESNEQLGKVVVTI